MKTFSMLLGVALLGFAIATFIATAHFAVKLHELTTYYENELRVEQTLYQACDARLMYTEQVLIRNGIDFIQ